MDRVYLATSLERMQDYWEVQKAFQKEGIQITYDWTTHGNVKKDLKELRRVCMNEIQGIQECDILVALLPGGRGTHCEIGIALGMGKPVLLVGEEKFFSAGEGTCAFYWAKHRNEKGGHALCTQHLFYTQEMKDQGYPGTFGMMVAMTAKSMLKQVAQEVT